ncbi:hypothetical protein BP6252_04977 [Coleophoma cylindrospora]|uniref:Proline dehydrogenase n=1 Tax=Coleophoma cylindrospora TaxID=1849047 RepID=A0A3D8RSS3_9HELO|nr:hypothetical protein BP6252_04977 [Coleophoma cylindrospora]
MLFIIRSSPKLGTSLVSISSLKVVQIRRQSTVTTGRQHGPPSLTPIGGVPGSRQGPIPKVVVNYLSRLSTGSLLKNIILGVFLTTPLLFKPGFAVFEKIANSNSGLCNPDKNPLIRALVRPLIYDHFCAGTNATEIKQTSSGIKRLGFSGIVLCYGKEVQVSSESTFVGQNLLEDAGLEREVAKWRDGNLETLDMVEEGDWLGMKISGAGTHITNSLLKGDEPPGEFIEALDAICERAIARGCRIWIDAEQQFLQPTIDAWTFPFMKKYNTGPQALIYSTIQAYLKESRDKIEYQLQLSQRENWRLGIKLVRGAYINNDMREKIHNTKADTDASYNDIVKDLLSGGFPVFKTYESPNFDFLLAGHNSHTIRTAAQAALELATDSKLKVVPEFAQLQGMADDIGCELLQMGDNIKKDGKFKGSTDFSLRVYKCLTWGSVQECMQYLLRRLVENRSASDRMGEGLSLYANELKRRIANKLWRRQDLL